MLLALGSAALGWGLVEMLDDDVAEGTSAAPRGEGGEGTPTASNADEPTDEPTDEPPADAGPVTAAPTFDLLTQAMAVEPSLLIAESGVADTVTGTAGDDVLIGTAGEADVLLGGAGDDILHVDWQNTAEGGEGADRFFVPWVPGEGTVIRDFNPAEDQLVLENDYYSIALYQTPDGAGLRFVDEEDMSVILTLEGVTLEPGETLEVIERYDGEDTPRSYAAPEDAGPAIIDAVIGASAEAEVIEGDAGANLIIANDVFAPSGGADTLIGGEGNDRLFSGSSLGFYESQWNHAPGSASLYGSDDALFGGEGNDQMYIGASSTATGGAGEDQFFMLYDNRSSADGYAEVTDFDPTEDQLIIDFRDDSDGEAEAVRTGLTLSYDSATDVTRIDIAGQIVAQVNGDQTGASVAVRRGYYTSQPLAWLDVAGNEIDAATGQAADIQLLGGSDFDLYGV